MSWLPALGGWLVTRPTWPLRVLRDSGRSPLTIPGSRPRAWSGRACSRWTARTPPPPGSVRPRVAGGSGQPRLAGGGGHRGERPGLAPAAAGSPAELRRGLAGPLAVTVMARMLGLDTAPGQLLAWYDAIVAGVSTLSATEGQGARTVPAPAARAFGELRAEIRAAVPRDDQSVLAVAARDRGLAEVVSNAAVLLFGGIETTEGMICNSICTCSGTERARSLCSPTAACPERRWRSRCGWTGGRGRRPVLHRRRPSRARGDPAGRPGHGVADRGEPRSRRSSLIRTGTTCAGTTPGWTWRSRAARISALAPSWPGWRRGRRSAHC